MKIFITGVSGYLGSHIAAYFKDKYEVLSPTHNELDLTDELSVREYILFNKPDYILHAANVGKYGQYVPDAIEQNTRMYINLARMQDFYKRLIYLGSGALYDKQRSLNMVSEDDFGEFIPQDQYGLSKYLSAAGFAEQKNAMVLQLFGVYGEDEGDRFPSYAIKQAIDNLPIVIHKDAWFDYLYVDDLCRIVEHFLTTKKLVPFCNIGTGVPVELLEIAKKAVKLAKSTSEIITTEDGLANAYTCNITLLKKLLPKFKFTTIDEGLRKLYDWYKMEGKN